MTYFWIKENSYSEAQKQGLCGCICMNKSRAKFSALLLAKA